ncbi:MAG: hypothetical protein HQL40_00200 [Alphaproteobacteria bacterium]|nr:hypothetical protein [Alphaproteobacteria bacterium]MBF0332052.1 hypothetical protein [Alphaproteobacteria bacterium]
MISIVTTDPRMPMIAGDVELVVVEDSVQALDRGVAQARGEMCAVFAPGAVPLPGAFELVARLAALFPEMSWLSSTQPVIAAADGRLAPSFLPGFSRAAFLDGVCAIQTEGTFWRRSLWEAAGGTFAEGASGLWARFFQQAEPCAVLASLAISPAETPIDETVLAAWRARLDHRPTPSGANGFRVYEGDFVTAEPSLIQAPFLVIDGAGPSRGLKEAIAAGRVA